MGSDRVPQPVHDKLAVIRAITTLANPCCDCCGSRDNYADAMMAIREVVDSGTLIPRYFSLSDWAQLTGQD